MTVGAAIYGLIGGIGFALISLWYYPLRIVLIYDCLWILFSWFVVWPIVWRRSAKIESEVKPQ